LIQKKRMGKDGPATEENQDAPNRPKTWTHLTGQDNIGETIKMISVYLEKEYDVGQLEELARIILTEDEDPERMHYAIIGLRKLLSLHEDNPIQQVIDLNLSQKLVDFMDVEKFPHIMVKYFPLNPKARSHLVLLQHFYGHDRANPETC
jgi:hypothetical protein